MRLAQDIVPLSALPPAQGLRTGQIINPTPQPPPRSIREGERKRRKRCSGLTFLLIAAFVSLSHLRVTLPQRVGEGPGMG